MTHERLNCREHPDIEEERGYRLKEDRTEVKRCFTALTETHAPPRFKLYEGNEKAEYDYYAVVTNHQTHIFGFDEVEYLATISAMESTPLITEHRSPAQDDTHITTTR